MGEMGEHILDSARVLPAGPQRLGFTFRHQDLPETLESILDLRKGA
jgi:NAD dependent epimerase/dehydratase family enzyme